MHPPLTLRVRSRSISNCNYSGCGRNLNALPIPDITVRFLRGTIVYKGLLTPEQLAPFYADLKRSRVCQLVCDFHQRLLHQQQPSLVAGTTLPLCRAQREINTSAATGRWFQARARKLRDELALSDKAKLLHAGMSDSASFDNALEAFVRSGSSIAESALRLVPPHGSTMKISTPDCASFSPQAHPSRNHGTAPLL